MRATIIDLNRVHYSFKKPKTYFATGGVIPHTTSSETFEFGNQQRPVVYTVTDLL